MPAPRHFLFVLTLGFALSTPFAHAQNKDLFGADRHVARGVACTACHGKDMANPEYPEESTCVRCHPKAALAEKTKSLRPNPHAAPHNGDCTLCHMQHEPTVNYCNQCHQFDFGKVP